MDGPSEAAAACATNIDAMTCIDCCQVAYMEGAETFSSAIVACACSSTGNCESDCKTSVCAKTPSNPAAGSSCAKCLDMVLATGGACVTPVSNACNADPVCVSYVDCASGCPM